MANGHNLFISYDLMALRERTTTLAGRPSPVTTGMAASTTRRASARTAASTSRRAVLGLRPSAWMLRTVSPICRHARLILAKSATSPILAFTTAPPTRCKT